MLGCLAVFAACNTDVDSNPVVGSECYPVPQTFVLNTPAYSTQDIDLQKSKTLNLTWSQPNYGFPTTPVYSVEMSGTGNFTTLYTEDEDGNVIGKPDYVLLDETVKGKVTGEFTSSEIDKTLEKLMGWKEATDIPEKQKLFFRIKSALVGADGKEYGVVRSNIVELKVLPYYEALKAADPDFWYMVGGCIGDGSWSNNADGKGVSIMPLFAVDGEKYDAKTGDGLFEYVSWFPAGGSFKILEFVGNWDYGICADGAYRNAGDDPGDIKVADAGYYTITLNTASHEFSMKAYEGTPKVYESICLAGTFNDWGDQPMSAFNTYDGAENHIWTANFTAGDGCKLKFKMAGSWDDNWGSTSFPYGTGKNGGADIEVEPGDYIIYFNDITGQYNFIKK